MPTPQSLRDFERAVLRPLLKRASGKAVDNSVQPILHALSRSVPKFEADLPDVGDGQTILFLSAYPATSPRHGGQKRLANLIEVARERRFRVRKASFFPAYPFYLDWTLGQADMAIQPDLLRDWNGYTSDLITDLATGPYVASNRDLLDDLEKYSGRADIIFLEQPWLLPVVRKLKERPPFKKSRVVYGSQNIEHLLKRDIFRHHGFVGGEPLIEGVRALEQECAKEADLVVAVTQSDADEIKGWTESPIILATNGIASWQSTEEARVRWMAELKKTELVHDERFGLYVASAHAPNISGFCESFGVCLGGLAPGQKIVVAGGATEQILSSSWFKAWGTLNRRRVIPVAVLPEGELSALRDLAHVFIVPVTSGGGSNLKMAEALYSGRHVVATPYAMRGYERFSGLKGISIAEPGVAFSQAVSQVLKSPLPDLDRADLALREELTWTQTLAGVFDHIEAWNV